jgi:hypothetical protein
MFQQKRLTTMENMAGKNVKTIKIARLGSKKAYADTVCSPHLRHHLLLFVFGEEATAVDIRPPP